MYAIVEYQVCIAVSLYLNEFSDHCPIEFALDFSNILYQKVDCFTYEKIIWNSENQEYFHTVLQENQNIN